MLLTDCPTVELDEIIRNIRQQRIIARWAGVDLLVWNSSQGRGEPVGRRAKPPKHTFVTPAPME